MYRSIPCLFVLIHVDPEPIDINARVGIEEAGKLIIPPLLHFWVEPIGKSSHTGPDHPLVDGSVLVDKVPIVSRNRKRRICQIIVFLLLVCHGRIHHDDVMLVIFMEVIDNLSNPIDREAIGVGGHDKSLVHVVYVPPEG